MSNFWGKLNKPVICIAPMEDVTDFVFREVVATHLPRPDVFFTEFTNVDGLMSVGQKKLLPKLKYSEEQRPIVAQIWGTNPENIYKSAKLIQELNFDGVDINMGCPVPAVTKKGAGSGHINNPELASEIIDAAKKGADKIPVSVKTRLGFKKIQTEEWISFLLKQDIRALTIHGRIASEMSKFPANWEEIGKAVKLRDQISPKTLIIGNGDVKSMSDAREKVSTFGVDGVMIARGIFNNPWVFENIEKTHSKDEYFEVLTKHLKLFEQTYGDKKHYDTMKKFYKMYVKGFDGANEIRQKLMETKNAASALEIIENY